MSNTVNGVQGIIGYVFNDPYLVVEAVTAAGSRTSSGNRQFADGNKRLAVLGDTVLQLALAQDWYDGNEPRGAFTKILQRVGSNSNISRVGLANNLDAFVLLAGAQSTISPGTMAATVEALIGAVYLDSNDMNTVKAVMQTLDLV
ncbi:MAG: hypothetical protein LQ346_008307 [Caloplaca aetnensis]|nr:MAG: hypothetical protein LQ346_008307 [Caloplaca aetnensis]